MKYHVTFYFLASGMEGHADKRDYGIVDAESADAAKSKVIGAEFPDADDASKSFILGCLTAKPIASKAAPAGEREVVMPEISAMAKVLSDRAADACNINRDDNWAMYGQEYIDDVQAMLGVARLNKGAGSHE